MHLGQDLLVLGILFVIAYGLGRLGKRVGLPSIPIYMLVGLLASPHFHFFPLSFKATDVELIAVFGLIFLLFNLGLEFDQEEFFGNAGALLLSGGTRIAINMAVGLGFGFWLGWGPREALIIAGMTATSSSAIITKLLIELRRLSNRETPIILGITVVEDVFVAVYLAIVAVVIGGETNIWGIVLQLAISFSFLIVMFVIARWGGRVVSRLIQTQDDELFTILFFGLAVAFGGIGEMLGVSDAIGAFLIGLVLGATRFRTRVESFSLPLRDVFGAFFFLNFGLALDPSTFGPVAGPVAVAVALTLVINIGGGQIVAWQNKLSPAEGLNAGTMLQNRGEFALILATLATAAGLDARLTPFAGLYVLTMAIIGPVLAVNSERIGAVVFRPRGKRKVQVERAAAERAAAERASVRAREADQLFALVSGTATDDASASFADSDSDEGLLDDDPLERETAPVEHPPSESDDPDPMMDPTVRQAMEQSDQQTERNQVERKRDPEY